MQRSSKRDPEHIRRELIVLGDSNVEAQMSECKSLYLVLVASLAFASPVFAQAFGNGVEIQSGDVWLLPSDQASPTVVVLRHVSSSDSLSLGDVWLSPDHQLTPSVTAEEFPGNAALVTRNE
jgi:hypothetical protein